MDRNMVYPGAIPLDTDILTLQRSIMKAFGFLAQATIGTGTIFDGLACAQQTVPNMTVQVAPGSAFFLSTVDSSSFGSLNSDASPLVKFGVNLASVTLNTPAPGTGGQSINYLVQAAFSEADGTSVVLPYYNSANPAVPFSGPANAGTPQNTQRLQTVNVTVKAGTPATTGTQTTPAPDSGFTGLYVVTVANGAVTVVNANISTVSGAPFISMKLPTVRANFTGMAGDARNTAMSVTAASATATFTADEIVVETALGGSPYKLASYSKAVNLATTGAGGMDTGAAPVSGYVALYAILNPTSGATSILAVNATSAVAPAVYGGANMPAGYTASALISVWPTNGSSQFVVGYQRGRKINLASATLLSTSTPVGNTSLSISAFAPQNAVRLYGNLNGLSTATSAWVTTVFSTAQSVGGIFSGFGVAAVEGTSAMFVVDISVAQQIFYSLTGSGGTPTTSITATAYEI